GAIYWARPKALYFGNSRGDAAKIGFDDQFIYDEIKRLPGKRKIKTVAGVMAKEATELFKEWKMLPGIKMY
ncbi:MAG: tRNA-specific adenosine deaminase, partial [Candidatus Gracilibacteria bacterium]